MSHHLPKILFVDDGTFSIYESSQSASDGFSIRLFFLVKYIISESIAKRANEPTRRLPVSRLRST